MKNILTCKQLQEKKPELYEYINKRYKDLHGSAEQPPTRQEKDLPNAPNFREPNISSFEPAPNKEVSPNPIPVVSNLRPPEASMNPGLAKGRKPGPPTNPLVNTPTQPGKYFNDQNAMPAWKHTPTQMTSNRMIYPNTPGQQRSARPFIDNFSLGPAADNSSQGLASRALNLQSKDFKPKTQQVQEYLKKDEATNLPSDFMDSLTTTLNMTGTDQIQQNAERLEEEIEDEYISLIAHYIVVRRVIESDEKRIDFFANFFHCMKNHLIVKALINECIDVILRIIINESADPNNRNEASRQATTPIKNVACFLGYLTLVHNRPLLSKDLDLKQLLLEGHEKKCMTIVIMVVCKILRTGEKSRIFTPYNPWMIGIYSMLLEYITYYSAGNSEQDSNIGKEIQLVLRNRKIDMDPLGESRLFRDFDQKNSKNKEIVFLNHKMLNDPLIQLPNIPLQMKPEVPMNEDGKQEEVLGDEQYDNIFNLDIVVVSESSKKFPQIDQNHLKMLTKQGINQAMREIIQAVIRRVIPIASITTRLLVLKDFALEPDPEKLRQASICTAKSLAGMLAQITCKDILKYQFIKSLKDLVFPSTDGTLSSLSEEQKRDLIETITKENSEIGCNKIVAAVQNEALNNISKDDSISEAILKRKEYQENGTDFRDLSNIENFNKLPPLLKPLDTGLTDAEFQVYQDFETIAANELENQIQQDTFRLLDDDHPAANEEVKTSYNQNTIENKTISDNFLSICSSFVSNEQKLIDFTTAYKKEISELKLLMDKVPHSDELLTDKFLVQHKPIALNSHLLVALVENRILSLESWQKKFAFHLRQTIESMNDRDIIEFIELFIIRAIIDKGIVKDTHISDLLNCVEMFSKTKNNPNTKRWKLMLDLIKATPQSTDLYEELAAIYFEQWVRSPDMVFQKHKFCYKIGVVFKHSQNMEMFLRNSLQTAIDSASKDNENEEENTNFMVVDKFASMIISCSFNWIPQPGVKALNVIDEAQALNIFWEVMEENHNERLTSFDQIPYKRILMYFLKHFEVLFKNMEFGDLEKNQKMNEILMMFSNLFKKMNPISYPGFAFAWLELISCPSFMPMMLNSGSDNHTTERWFKLHELFNEQFNFLKENIYENSPTSPALEKFFEGTLKLVLVVLHDYPEFLCYYYFQFINHLPLYRTGNLRNMILAAYPRTMRLPDPAAEITKFEINNALFCQDPQTLLKYYADGEVFDTLKSDLDSYLRKSNLNANFI